MKVTTDQIIQHILLAMLLACCSIANSAPAKSTIGVIAHSDFVPDRVTPQKGASIGLPEDLADRITEHLTNGNRFTLIERKALRRLVLEQRFGKEPKKTFLDRTLNKAIDDMDSIENGGAAIIAPSGPSTAGRVVAGAGAIGTTGALSDYNDILKDFQRLGSALGADFLVLGSLEKLKRSTKKTAVPYSSSGRTVRKNLVDARLRLRVIDAKRGTVAGATSIHTQIPELLFEGRVSDTDKDSIYDHLGKLAAAKVLDLTFPAKVVSVEPLIISRGSNDGIAAGDIFLIKREGKEIKDSNGLVIARLKSEVGEVKVISVQKTIAIVNALSRQPIQEGDLAELHTQTSQSKHTVATSTGVPLTRGPAQQQQKGIPRVALGLVKSGSTARTGKKSGEHIPLFTDTIISRLTQTKRFQLIDRQEVDQLLTEQQAQALAENRDMPSAMGTLQGADYLVYGSLASINVESSKTRLPNSTRSFDRKIGHVSGNMRIVDARSGDILESRTVTVKQVINPKTDKKRIRSILADAYAKQVVVMLMNAVYPIKAAHVSSDGIVYVNRGSDGGLTVGELLTAYTPGQAIIDPDTGVQLGVEESMVGKISLTEVEDARSKGSVVEGRGIARGDILKRTVTNKDTRASVANHKHNTAPKRTGGALASQNNNKPQQRQKVTGKATIVVGKIRLNPSARITKLGKGHIKRITDDMLVKFTNTNRFVVMERQEIDQILNEKTFEAMASGGDIHDRLGELEGADYLVHGELTNFYFKKESKNVPYLDEVQVTITGIAEGMMRIVDVHSGKVIAADKIKRRMVVKNEKDTTQLTSALLDKFTTAAVAEVIGRLYPIKILGVAGDGAIYLNRGEDAGLTVGKRYNVMRPGQELIDPDTGRSFGSAETKVAVIGITEIEANRSRAQVISGREVQRGDFLRKLQAPIKKSIKKTMQPNW